MSTTTSAGQASAPSQGTQHSHNRNGHTQRRSEGTDAPAADLFAQLLGLMADAPEADAAALELAADAAPAERPDPVGLATPDASVRTDSPWPLASTAATTPVEAPVAREPLRPDAGLYGVDAGQAGIRAQAGAEASRQNTAGPAEQVVEDAPLPEDLTLAEPDTTAPPADQTHASRPGGASGRGTDRSVQLHNQLGLRNGDRISWRATAPDNGNGSGNAGAIAASATATAWSASTSTVALHHRIGLATVADRGDATLGETADATPFGLTGVGGAGASSGASARDSATGQHPEGGAADSGGADSISDRTGNDPADPPGDEAWNAQAGDDGADDLRGWTAGALRQASLRVGEDSEEAIDIELSLRGQDVSVDFRTDNPEARHSLQHHAGQTLSDLLQRSGMQLAGLSVGGQAAGDRQASGGESRPSTGTRPVGRRHSPDGSDAVAHTARPASPNRGTGPSSLDLFV